MKRSYHKLLFLLVFMMMFIVYLTKGLPDQQVQASDSSENSARSYFNVICKYLYLGKADRSVFDFNIKKDAMEKDAVYRWYVVKEKGNPKAITIDEDLGTVTAKHAGTAYIICEITQPDGTVLKPEAKVVVINNITKVGISNIPENGTILAGATLDLNEAVLMTSVGKVAETDGITRWEIMNDTASVGEVTEKGVLVPKKPGEFRIRAVCFQSIEDYRIWLMNKEANSKRITASSDWVTIKVLPSEGEAVTQEQLNKLLASPSITKITCDAENLTEITIPEGDYSDKTLTVSQPKCVIKNYGTFKHIIITSAYGARWEENKTDNSFEIYDSIINFHVTVDSQVKDILFGSISNNENVSLKNTTELSVTGKLINVDVTATSNITLTGAGEINAVKIEKNAAKSQIVTTFKSEYTLNSDLTIALLPGAEESIIRNQTEGILRIENLSKSYLELYTANGYLKVPEGQGILVTPDHYELLGYTHASSIVKLMPEPFKEITASSVPKGYALTNSTLTGDFIFKYDKVPGMLSWVKPSSTVDSTGYYEWIFMPNDQGHYYTIYGKALVIAE